MNVEVAIEIWNHTLSILFTIVKSLHFLCFMVVLMSIMSISVTLVNKWALFYSWAVNRHLIEHHRWLNISLCLLRLIKCLIRWLILFSRCWILPKSALLLFSLQHFLKLLLCLDSVLGLFLDFSYIFGQFFLIISAFYSFWTVACRFKWPRKLLTSYLSKMSIPSDLIRVIKFTDILVNNIPHFLLIRHFPCSQQIRIILLLLLS